MNKTNKHLKNKIYPVEFRKADYSTGAKIARLFIIMAVFGIVGLAVFYSFLNKSSKDKEQFVSISGLSDQEVSFLTNQGFLPAIQGEKEELTITNLKSPGFVEQNLNSPNESFEVLATKLDSSNYQLAFKLENKSGQEKEFYLIPISKESQLQFEEIKGVVNNGNTISISKEDAKKEPLEQLFDVEKHKKELKPELTKAYDDIASGNYQASPIKITLAAKSTLLAQSKWQISRGLSSGSLEPVYFLVYGSAGGVKDDLIILNVHSSPQKGENWEVSFTTNGTADLKIIPNDQATIDDDEFVSLSCNGEERVPQILEGDVIYYPNWECQDIGKVVHYTKKAGEHTLRFEFGDQVAFAYNQSSNTIVFRNNVILRNNVIIRSGSAAAWACGDSVNFTYRSSSVTYGTVNGTSSLCWLDRNLGASQVAASSTDGAAYGDLFQWGRLDDSHQATSSDTTTATSSSDVPNNGGKFIYGSSDWRDPKNDLLWQGASGINNPCPSGWRIPTYTEWENERLSWSSQDPAGAFANSLKLPAAGYRNYSDAVLRNTDDEGDYYSSTVNGAVATCLEFATVPPHAYMVDADRAYGVSVRCIKD